MRALGESSMSGGVGGRFRPGRDGGYGVMERWVGWGVGGMV